MPRFLFSFFLLLTSYSPALTAELLMVEQVGCEWCALWNEEIGGIYDKTEEGQRATLVRHDISTISELGYELDSGVRYTPTFILIEDNQEVGRIAGYPGEDSFWPMLNSILEQLSN